MKVDQIFFGILFLVIGLSVFFGGGLIRGMDWMMGEAGGFHQNYVTYQLMEWGGGIALLLGSIIILVGIFSASSVTTQKNKAPKVLQRFNKTTEEKQFCFNCGEQIPINSTFCLKCGEKQ